MSSKIAYLHGKPSPIAVMHRVGRQDHRLLERLHARGRFRPQRTVFSAAWISAQADLLKTLREDGTEIILDPATAELASIGRYKSSAKNAPWANANRPLTTDDLAQRSFLQELAEYALANQADSVFAPGTFNADLGDYELATALNTAAEFRHMLDLAGGKQIKMDFQLMTRYGAFRDGANRRRCLARLADATFDRLWLRIADYGADAGPSKIQRYILSASDYAQLGKPLIADMVGGIAAMALPAFGVVSGLSHGIMASQRFDLGSWLKAPKPREKGGKFAIQPRRTYLPGLDRSLTVKEVEEIFSARGAKPLLQCADRQCCPHGREMLSDPHAHFLYQTAQQLARMQAVPDHRRSDVYLDDELRQASRVARKATQLALESDSLKDILTRAAKDIEDKRLVLEKLQERADGELTRARPVRDLKDTQQRAAQGSSGPNS